MKRLVTSVLAGTFSVIFFLLFSSNASAISLYQPFGGRVISTFTPGVTCRGEGPITIRPVGLSTPTGPYVIQLGQTTLYQYYTVHTGSWILGLYNPIPSFTSCFTDSLPPFPVPTFAVKIFGSSL